LDQLRIAQIFSKIDVQGAYTLVWINPRDKWKITFITRYRHFEYKVMPFGFTNAPVIFQYMMNDTFREYLDHFVVIYLNNILIFSSNMKKHTKYIQLVIAKLQEHELYAKSEKCEFDRTSVEFFGYVISTKRITMDTQHFKSIQEWAILFYNVHIITKYISDTFIL
jgi:hypothetical protein